MNMRIQPSSKLSRVAINNFPGNPHRDGFATLDITYKDGGEIIIFSTLEELEIIGQVINKRILKLREDQESIYTLEVLESILTNEGSEVTDTIES